MRTLIYTKTLLHKLLEPRSAHLYEAVDSTADVDFRIDILNECFI